MSGCHDNPDESLGGNAWAGNGQVIGTRLFKTRCGFPLIPKIDLNIKISKRFGRITGQSVLYPRLISIVDYSLMTNIDSSERDTSSISFTFHQKYLWGIVCKSELTLTLYVFALPLTGKLSKMVKYTSSDVPVTSRTPIMFSRSKIPTLSK